jgi:thiamine biosynthesis lipoprotein
MRRRTFIAASLGTAASALSACASRAELHTGATLAFGTTVSVSVVHEDALQAELAIGDALAAAHKVDRLMSVYNAASQVALLNEHGSLGSPDPHLLAVLAKARELSQLTRGAFDITVQPLWSAFRAAAQAGAVPGEAERLAIRSRVGWQRVRASRESVSFAKPHMAITLNGLAQGYAADLAMAALRARGIRNALLDTGEFAAQGERPDHGHWTLGILDPRDRQAIAATLQLDGRCVATSGDYQAPFTPDFVHHHIFDPATGISPQELASVTVLAASAMQADGLSTAFMVLGARKAHALAARLPGVDLMTINKRGVVWKSPGFPAA